MITPQGIQRLIDDIREEATERLETAKKALQGVPLEQPDHRSPIPEPPNYHQIEIEHPAHNPQNPQAAILGHVSDAERRYLAVCDLLENGPNAHQPDPAYEMGNRGGPHGLLQEDREEHLRRLRHELRAEAKEAIKTRLEVTEHDDEHLIEDPVTGYRRVVRHNPESGKSDRHFRYVRYLENTPDNLLNALVDQINR